MSEKAVPAGDRQSSGSLSIPTRRVVVKDPNELPSNYCMTPGGTMFSTTPGGTRIIYDRKFLLQMRNSPLSKTPPAKLATIPDIVNEEVIESDPVKITTPDVEGSNKRHEGILTEQPDLEMFEMDDH